jgi:hypothetical protein
VRRPWPSTENAIILILLSRQISVKKSLEIFQLTQIKVDLPNIFCKDGLL